MLLPRLYLATKDIRLKVFRILPGREEDFRAQAVIIHMHQIRSIFLLTVHQRFLVYAAIVIISNNETVA